ncbi:MAG TPA: hypothetical protein PLH79_19295, partial [bacterium]|nr:hypothetical protein [bacterium]
DRMATVTIDVPLAEDPFASIRSTLATSSRDWSASSDLAWIYGIVFGWEYGDAMTEVAGKHGWSTEKVERLKRLHATYSKTKI